MYFGIVSNWIALKIACLQAVTGCFIAENPPFANRAPSWIFEARAPGYERVSAKIEGGGGGGKRKTVFHPSQRPPPLAHFVNSPPGPDLAARIQDGDLITNSGFFDPPSNRLRAGYLKNSFQIRSLELIM